MIKRKAIIGAEYAAVQPKCSHLFGQRIAQADFKHAYATVCSRAWGIEALQTIALVLADHDYAVGTQVFAFLA
ncbi:hypothetical protein R1flu_006771 [Riccia fluitans]|uniref:Uncharacterized protein n=1 Tax=Riccia fluitans TaxID=41844 RepID=A0ABD1YZZ7_9MARC